MLYFPALGVFPLPLPGGCGRRLCGGESPRVLPGGWPASEAQLEDVGRVFLSQVRAVHHRACLVVDEGHAHDAARVVAAQAEVYPQAAQTLAQLLLRGFPEERFPDPAPDLPPRVVLSEAFGAMLHVPLQAVVPDLFPEEGGFERCGHGLVTVPVQHRVEQPPVGRSVPLPADFLYTYVI